MPALDAGILLALMKKMTGSSPVMMGARIQKRIQSRNNSLMLVLALVFSSTRLTITAQ